MTRCRRFTVAAAQYAIGRPGSFEAYEERISGIAAAAADGGASLLLFPE
ncbi:hypothetical protein NUH88_17070 [Nisaea acidiphila]|uniref:CN hydrolase domain-containing protein n=1 Tax=Nisaea acidiphila TaxID=1862145 RepID=A0A9J7APG4_9PROT|nr:hypothetical protein [Nisaea acidiphila]UUX49103.1 hypothetical protein NUH88_17070 [Nisaea acidiphila]